MKIKLLALTVVFAGVIAGYGFGGSTFHSYPQQDVPDYRLAEGFTNTSFPPAGWTVEFENKLYWFRDVVSSYGIGQGCAVFDFYDALEGTNQSLITSSFTPTVAGDSLRFDHAYATYETENDQLQIETSTNGGTTFTVLVTLDGGVSGPLVTAPPTLDPFAPDNSQWATKKFSLPAGTNKIRFRAISAYGNNLFIDSICVGSSTTGIHNLSELNGPDKYSLSQNYPNPFNPVTKIEYYCPVQGHVSLKIFDLLGKEVASLADEVKPRGNHSVVFDAGNLPAGIYFCKMETPGFSDVLKMMLVK